MKKVVLQIKVNIRINWKLPTNIETANIRGWKCLMERALSLDKTTEEETEQESRKKKLAAKVDYVGNVT